MAKGKKAPEPETEQQPETQLEADAGVSEQQSAPQQTLEPSTETSSSEGLAAALEAQTQAAQAANAPEAPSFIDNLRSQGIDLPQDESAAAQYLAGAFKQARELQQLAQYGQVYLQHQADFDKWRQSQQTIQQQQEKPWWSEVWNPPEYNPIWERMVLQDDKGNLVAAPGAPPDIVPKYLAYQQYRRDAAEKFLQNPYQFMEQGVQKLVPKMVQEAIDRSLGQHKESTLAAEFAKENANWLYQTGANNQVLQDPITGERLLSEWGTRFREHAVKAGKMGLQTVEAQREYAIGMVQRDYALSQLQQLQTNQQQASPPLTPREKANQEFLQKTPHKVATRTGISATEPAQTQLDLHEMLSRSFKQNGINEIA